MTLGKSFPVLASIVAIAILLAGCTVNEATGRNQLTALMPTAQEQNIGAEEQAKAERTYGVYNNPTIQAYVDDICARIVPGLERRDVTYTCTVLDSPVVNAFALPGGYININRGVVTAANDEAELASVIAHEMGHVNAKHIAERYSGSVLAQLGTSALSAALGNKQADQALSVGSSLFFTSFSRDQEYEGDNLGVRYLNRAGYNPYAMAGFLENLKRISMLEAAEQGQQYREVPSYFATHPQTSARIEKARAEADAYPTKGQDTGVSRHMRMINGMVYGDNRDQGFMKGLRFIHPTLGFSFTVPANYRVQNTPSCVIAISPANKATGFVFDAADKAAGMSPLDYLTRVWAQGKAGLSGTQTMTVNGMRAATAQMQGQVDGTPVLVRLVAIEWAPDQVYRFQFSMPQATDAATIEAFQRTTYSFAALSDAEKTMAKPKTIRVVTVGPRDTYQTLLSQMASDDTLTQQRFMTLNGIDDGQPIIAGRMYKLVVE